MSTEKQDKGRLALKAGFWYVVSSVLVKAMSTITTPIFTRLLSTEEYGTVQTFGSWDNLLITFFSLNLTYSIGRAKLDFEGELDKYIGSMQLLGTLFSFLLSSIVIIFISPFSSIFELTKFQSILLVSYMLFQNAITLNQNGFRYRYQYKQNIAIAWYSTLSTSILSLILIYVFRYNRDDLRIIGLVSPTILLSLYFWIKNIHQGNISVNWEHWKYGLKLSLPLILHTVSLHILAQSDRIFITKICGKTDTAFYSLAYAIGSLLTLITGAVSQGWLPWFHDTYFEGKFEEIKKNAKPIVILGCYGGLACIALAPEIVLVMGGSRYLRGVPCVAPVVLGVICSSIYTHYVNIELHLKKTIFVSAGTIIAACFNIAANAIFIPIYGFVAAAYTTLAGYMLLMFIHFLITRKVLKVRLYDDLFMFGSMLMTAVVAGVLIFTYDYRVIRYCLTGVGFISFVGYFRKFIVVWIRGKRQKK